MQFTLSVCGHSVSISGFRVGNSHGWSNSCVSTNKSDFSRSLFVSYFWEQYFYRLFYPSRFRNNYLNQIKYLSFFGVLFESLSVRQQFQGYKFTIGLYIDLKNFLFKKFLRSSETGFTHKNTQWGKGKNFRHQNVNFRHLDFRGRAFIDLSAFRKAFRKADRSIREPRYVVLRSRAKRNYSLPLVNEESNVACNTVCRYPYAAFLFLNSVRKPVYYRACSTRYFTNKFWTIDSHFLSWLVLRIDKFLFFFFCFRKFHNFIAKYLARHIMSVLASNEFELDLHSSNSFAYPNAASQFIILKLRRWYKIGEIFGQIKRIYARRHTLNGLFIQAKGRLTKRQRASVHRLHLGSTPFASVSTPLYFFQKVYPLKYGKSSVSVCVYMSS